MFIITGALLLGMVLMGVRWFMTADTAQIHKIVRYSFITLAILALILLALSGRVAGLLVGLVALLPFTAYIQRLRRNEDLSYGNNGHEIQILAPEILPPIMPRQQALDILGLQGHPSQQQVIDAHRRLLQKIHPHKGGSMYLAAQVNQARDVLLTETMGP